MKNISVSLDISTPSLSLDELSRLLGRRPSSGSHDRGDFRRSLGPEQRRWTETVWRMESTAKSSDIGEHLASLVAQCPPEVVSRGALSRDCKTNISVAVFFDTANVSISVGPEHQKVVAAYQSTLEINCYPCESVATV
jgi:hypothetical protein